MPSSRKPCADDIGGDLPTKRRKITGNANSGTINQRSLSELFRDQRSTLHQKSSASELVELESQAASVQDKHPTASTPNISLDRMYSFPTTSSGTNDIIDLTGSSPPSSNHPGRVAGHGIARSTAFAPHQGSKKLVVKNFRTRPRIDPEQYFKKVWAQLDAALSTILGGEKAQHSLEELYKGAENLCRQGKSAELHTCLRTRCESYLASEVRLELARRASQLSDADLLSIYLKTWGVWNEKLVTVRSIFFFLDQTYLLRHADHPGIIEMGRTFFKNYIFYDECLKPKIMQGVMELIDLDRRSTDGSLSDPLRKSIAMFQDLGTYFTDFEPQFKQVSEAFVHRWGDEETSKGSLSSYTKNSHSLRTREMIRCEVYSFDRSTQIALSLQLDRLLVERRHEFLTDEDFNLELLEDNDANALKDVYTLLERIHKGVDLVPIFEKYIRDEGATIIFDEQREPEMVIRLLDFKKKLDRLHRNSFSSNEEFGNGLHKAFEQFINRTKKSDATWKTDNAKAGEMIAKHVDLLLKGGVKAIPKTTSTTKELSGHVDDEDDDEKGADEDAEINRHLSLALDLFRFVHGKAVFEAFYKKDLARRLLMGRSASSDAERNMLGRLKTECGAGFTQNLEAMFKDMDLARDEMASYNRLQSDRGTRRSGPDLNVSVLSSAAWPSYPDISITIPSTISKVISDFEDHYKQKHTGRKLHWKHVLAHCQLKAHYPRGIRKELAVSGFQAIVLLLFNDLPADDPKATITYTDIRTATSLPDSELQRTLQSLACAKYRLLIKHPKGRDVHETDSFSYNGHFSDPKTRIKINQIQLKETQEENKETHIRVAADRHFETQAAVVRVMKSRKTIGHAELVAEVIKATISRGVLEPADIKKNIDKLMEKDYMERTDGNSYSYVA